MTEKKLTYTLLAEGIAENCFIPKYLESVANSFGIKITNSNKRLKNSSHPSKSKVLKNIFKFAIDSIADEEDLFIAGVDLDKADHTPDQQYHSEELARLQKEVKGVNHTIILFVPVQVFDTWLLYYNKATAHSLEKHTSDEIKEKLYRVKKSNLNGSIIKSTCEKIVSENIDYNNLAKLSRSFNHFHRQVIRAFEQLANI